ncbi:MAG: hypothetical protein II102_03300 [Bacteroidales bacterium]|nr:hypothetical protein [Bacteroidales bacterium]
MVLAAGSCDKDNTDGKDKVGVDGETPLPEAVDLGTVVNGKTVKWASFNLGASRDYEYGNYYAWGEASAKEDYSWGTYAFADGANNKLTKYCTRIDVSYWGREDFPDGQESLLPEDDIAKVKLGGKWRMPTEADFNALFALKENPDYEWEYWVPAKDAEGNGLKDAAGKDVLGLRITRKSTGASLFLPMCGYSINTNLGFMTKSTGYYWTSDLNFQKSDEAVGVFLSSSNIITSNFIRSRGHAIRPVCD